MTGVTFVLLCLAGGLGATARFMLDAAIRTRVTATLPWGTVIINLTGSFLLGLLTGIATAHALPDAWKLVVGTGFLGGYTTFSTASFETVRLMQERRYGAAFANGLGVLGGATAAAGLGLWCGGLL